MITVNGYSELEALVNVEKPVILSFYADWCSPCRALLSILKLIKNEHGEELIISKINVDENPELAVRFGVTSIPTLFLVKNKVLVEKITGLKTKEEMDEYLADLMSENISSPRCPIPHTTDRIII